MNKGQVVNRRNGGVNENGQHIVNTVQGGRGVARHEPCGGCPWRKDQAGEFPPEAFLASASTAYDMAGNTFGCHESSKENPAICAGFLLRGADHNMAVRMRLSQGKIDYDKLHDGGHELHESYRDMAEANGCDPEAEELRRCR